MHKQEVEEFIAIEPSLQDKLLYFNNFQLLSGCIIQSLPQFCFDFYKNFLRILLCMPHQGNLLLKKELIMQPLPPQMGQLHFFIKRKKSILNQTEFELQIEQEGSK